MLWENGCCFIAMRSMSKIFWFHGGGNSPRANWSFSVICKDRLFLTHTRSVYLSSIAFCFGIVFCAVLVTERAPSHTKLFQQLLFLIRNYQFQNQTGAEYLEVNTSFSKFRMCVQTVTSTLQCDVFSRYVESLQPRPRKNRLGGTNPVNQSSQNWLTVNQEINRKGYAWLIDWFCTFPGKWPYGYNSRVNAENDST